MKKKNKLFGSLALIVLCMAFMVYGVYAAKNASLTINGTIGFKAHGIEYAVSGFSVANALNAAGNTYNATDYSVVAKEGEATLVKELSAEKEVLYAGDGVLTMSEYNAEVASDSTFYFDDLTNSTADADNIADIVITLTITNASMFNVEIPTTEKDEHDNFVKQVACTHAGGEVAVYYWIASVTYDNTDTANADLGTAMAPATATGTTDGGVATVEIHLELAENETNYNYVDVQNGEGGETTRNYTFAKNLDAKDFSVEIELRLPQVQA